MTISPTRLAAEANALALSVAHPTWTLRQIADALVADGVSRSVANDAVTAAIAAQFKAAA